jgi:hypothetical protein
MIPRGMQPKSVLTQRAASTLATPEWLDNALTTTSSSSADLLAPSHVVRLKEVLLNTVAAALLKSPRFDVGLNDANSVVSRILLS